MSTIPLCVACRYYRVSWLDALMRNPYGMFCAHPTTTKMNPVDGTADYMRCHHARESMEPCGPQGKLFDPRKDAK